MPDLVFSIFFVIGICTFIKWLAKKPKKQSRKPKTRTPFLDRFGDCQYRNYTRGHEIAICSSGSIMQMGDAMTYNVFIRRHRGQRWKCIGSWKDSDGYKNKHIYYIINYYGFNDFQKHLGEIVPSTKRR